MIWRKHHRPRWTVTIWQSNCLLSGYAVMLETRSFRWRWVAHMYGVLAAPSIFGFRAEIERERPKLTVIDGGGAYEPRGVA